MISLTKIVVASPQSLVLSFSDGTWGEWEAGDILARDTVLTRPLADMDYFARAFIEGEALAWPNGLEFSARGLQRKLQEQGKLVRQAA